MEISQAGLDLIKRFEGLRLEAYADAVGVMTIGYGHTGDVKVGMTVTEHQADIILQYDAERFARAVTSMAPNATENQHAAMTSFAFNLGIASLARSTLLKKLLQGDIEGAAEAFGTWVYAGGKIMPGLVARREAEKELFLEP